MVKFYLQEKKPQLFLPANDQPKFFSFGIPTYTNLGDQAVSLAQRKYIENEFPNFQFIEILEEDTNDAIKMIQASIRPQDVVSFVGGGNMGNLYLDHEIARRQVFAAFPNNLTISFPQSIHFEDTAQGQREKRISQQAYAKNQKLFLLARDAQSYHRMQSTFNNRVLFTPDMVLYLKPQIFAHPRSGALFVFRHDSEKVVSESLIDQIYQLLNTERPIKRTDTVLDTFPRITPASRAELIQDELKLFSKQEIIITDRWHAMIFSVLTGTPCLLLGNSYNKGKHAYFDWLEQIDWVKYTDEDDPQRLKKIIAKLLQTPASSYDLRKDFKQLDDLLDLHTKYFKL